MNLESESENAHMVVCTAPWGHLKLKSIYHSVPKPEIMLASVQSPLESIKGKKGAIENSSCQPWLHIRITWESCYFRVILANVAN